jgi:hypothetical protein
MNDEYVDLALVQFHCEQCEELHFIPPHLVGLTSQERLNEIERVYKAGDMTEESYKHWKHVVIRYACILALKKHDKQGTRDSVGWLDSPYR